LIEEVTAHAQSDSLEDAREICADGTYFPNNLRNTNNRKNPKINFDFFYYLYQWLKESGRPVRSYAPDGHLQCVTIPDAV